MDLLHPKCAMAIGASGRCQRCYQRAKVCGDHAARDAQKPPEPSLAPNHAATPSTPPTGAVAPLPWRLLRDVDGECLIMTNEGPDSEGTLIAVVDNAFPDRAEATAAFIVLAANHHAALVEALEAMISEWAWMGDGNLEYVRDQSGRANHKKYTRILAARALLARVRGDVP